MVVAHALLRAAATLVSLPQDCAKTEASPGATDRPHRERLWHHKPLAAQAMMTGIAGGARTRACRVATLGDASGFSAAGGSDTSGGRSLAGTSLAPQTFCPARSDGRGFWWRTHSCVPCRHSCRHSTFSQPRGVGTSADAARRSACATSAPHISSSLRLGLWRVATRHAGVRAPRQTRCREHRLVGRPCLP